MYVCGRMHMCTWGCLLAPAGMYWDRVYRRENARGTSQQRRATHNTTLCEWHQCLIYTTRNITSQDLCVFHCRLKVFVRIPQHTGERPRRPPIGQDAELGGLLRLSRGDTGVVPPSNAVWYPSSSHVHVHHVYLFGFVCLKPCTTIPIWYHIRTVCLIWQYKWV